MKERMKGMKGMKEGAVVIDCCSAIQYTPIHIHGDADG
jgi:hypothetical protein